MTGPPTIPAAAAAFGLRPLGWALIRAPLLPVERHPAAVEDPGGGTLMPEDPLVRSALAVASDALAAALAGTPPSAPEAPRLRRALLRYLIRMSTRPTPFGLFAGVGLVSSGRGTDVALAAAPPQTRARADMGWLMGLVEALEREPAIRRELGLFRNPLALLRGGRVFLRESGYGSGPDAQLLRPVAMRATPAVRHVLARTRTPIAHADLAAGLLAFPGATPAKAERLIAELLDASILLTDLRPPLTGGDPGRHVHARLPAVEAAERARDGLGAVIAALEAWDAAPPADRARGWGGIVRRCTALHSDSGPTTPVQVDAALPMTGRRIDAAVVREATTAAELLLRLTPLPGRVPHLDAYQRRFEARYGAEREVPLVELVDPELGLGPMGQQDREWYAPPGPRERDRVRALREIAIDALREQRAVVELDDALMARLEVADPARVELPDSLEVAVAVAAASAAALDAGKFRLVVTPGVGADVAGCALGRFADLLGADAAAAWEELQREAEPPDGRDRAELVYLPAAKRVANVAVRPPVAGREVVCGVPAGGDPDAAITLDELLVGVRDGRFRVRRRGTAAELALSEHHMLDGRFAPPAIRFLQHVARDGRVLLGPFDWGPATEFPFLPRVQRGRVVLAPARWRLDRLGGGDGPAGSEGIAASADRRLDRLGDRPAGSEGIAAPADRRLDPAGPVGPEGRALEALAAWRERWAVPRTVYLAEGDQRLLLDLEAPAHVELLLDALRGGAAGRILEEALPGLDDAWLPGPHGRHLVELVVPLVPRRPRGRRRAVDAAAPADPPAASVRTRPPGSDWLFLRLDCPPVLQDDLIVDRLAAFAEFARSAALADDWFFIRYADPEPHLRLRLHGPPDVLRTQLLPQAIAWAQALVRDELCPRFALDTYDREVERYGGHDGVELAERIFGADSRAVASLLGLEPDTRGLDRTALAVAGIDGLLAGLGLSRPERLAWYVAYVQLGREDGQDYRARRGVLRALLTGAAATWPGGAAPAAALAAHRRALEPLGAKLRALHDAGRLTAPAGELLRSLVHMHCNRLLGTEAAREERALRLARRAVESLERAPAP